jgi:hypothetical protein
LTFIKAYANVLALSTKTKKELQVSKNLYESVNLKPQTPAESWADSQNSAEIKADKKQTQRESWKLDAASDQGTLPSDHLRQEGFDLDRLPEKTDEPETDLQPKDPEDTYN